ncbi:MAG: L-lactate dehydrogenase [Ruminococcaceae bacterium]|nr:L-lactate dehydrogenase [Oscillospiraceae bacterium]
MTDIRKCAIIGCGHVGATTAFSLMKSGLFSDMVLIDINKERAEGEAEDLRHGLPFLAPMEIYAGDYSDLADAGIVIITAGAAQKQGETRLDLLRANARVFDTIVGEICKHNQEAILLPVTNPVDVLTELTRRRSGFPPERVIGSGTVLDTARLKHLIGKRLAVDSRNVHAFIIGEHGDSELAVFSSANISGIDLDHFSDSNGKFLDGAERERLFCEVRDAAYSIIRAKGATYYAIAEAVRRIVTAIVRDEETVLPVSVATAGKYGIDGISLSLPSIVGRGGILKVLEIPLSKEERSLLEQSAARIKQAMRELA